jgi:lipoprotein-anchoring transpeptidase ErfK/SrfK
MTRFFTSAVLAVALITVPMSGDVFAAKSKTESVQTAKKPQPKKQAQAKAQTKVQGQKCKGFFQCLFGARKGVRVTNKPVAGTAVASLGGLGLSGRTSRRTVDWNEAKYPVGSLIVRTPERALYYISANGEAIRYSVGVGREGFQWSGNSRIVSKQEWPSWTPPKVMIEREAAKGHIIPPFMEGGPGNPLGARAMYIGGTIFRIHGTNNESSIGGAVSSGCIRMMNADVIDLYSRVKVGSKIYVYQ